MVLGIGFASKTWMQDRTLSLDFISQRYLRTKVNGMKETLLFNNLFNFSRLTSGYYVNAAGVYELSPLNEPRFEYSPISKIAQGLLIEGPRTNLILRSDDFSHAAWNKVACSVSANITIAPTGTAVADRVVEDTSTGAHQLEQGTFAVTSGVVYTYSIFAKYAGRQWLRLALGGAFGASNRIWVDIQNGILGTIEGATTATIEAFNNGWYRINYTRAATSTGSASAFIILTNTNNGGSYTGDGVSGIDLWGAQLEVGARQSSYISTAGSTVTRTGDLVSIPVTRFPFSNTAGTLMLNYSSKMSDMRIAQFANVSQTNRIEVLVNSASVLAATVISNSIVQASFGLGTNAGFGKVGLAWETNNFAACLNGGAVATDTSGTVSTVETLWLGSYAGSSTFLTGHLQTFAYYPRRFTSLELRGVTL